MLKLYTTLAYKIGAILLVIGTSCQDTLRLIQISYDITHCTSIWEIPYYVFKIIGFAWICLSYDVFYQYIIFFQISDAYAFEKTIPYTHRTALVFFRLPKKFRNRSLSLRLPRPLGGGINNNDSLGLAAIKLFLRCLYLLLIVLVRSYIIYFSFAVFADLFVFCGKFLIMLATNNPEDITAVIKSIGRYAPIPWDTDLDLH